MRSGQDYVASLDDGRAIYLGNERVDRVSTHPAFAAAVRTVASMYDALADSSGSEPAGSEPGNPDGPARSIWLIPRSVADLDTRRRAHQVWQELSFGVMGRTPDHVASLLSGFASAPSVFAKGDPQFAENVRRYHAESADQDRYIAYTIVPPQGDRSKPAHQQSDPHFYAGVVKERDDGIVLRGAMGVGTGVPLADAVFLSPYPPLRPGDEDYAISVAFPVASKGVKIFPRRSYATAATSVFDYPLSSRFDETDSLLVLDDVFVPWENVFVYRSLELTQAQWSETAGHLLANFQALIRLATKLRFLIGLARRVTEMHGTIALPPVQGQLGHLAAYAATVDAFVHAAQTTAVIDEHGVARPNPEMVYSALVLQPTIVNTAVNLARELAGGGLIALPSSADAFRSDLVGEDVRHYYQGGSASAEDRTKLLKLAWEMVGSEFAGRQMQYEFFYAGAPFVCQARNYRFYDWSRPSRLVDRCLADYELT